MPSSSTAPEGSGPASMAPNLPSDLREGYAEVGDQRLHYVEAGTGPLILLYACQLLAAGGQIAGILDTAPAGNRAAALRHPPRALQLTRPSSSISCHQLGILHAIPRTPVARALHDSPRSSHRGGVSTGR